VVWTVSPGEIAELLIKNSPLVQAIEESVIEKARGIEAPITRIVTQMDGDLIPQLTRTLVEAGVQLFSVEIKNPTLEDLFLSLTEGEKIE
jgi:ABC-2 type transport system ATP-binding protein